MQFSKGKGLSSLLCEVKDAIYHFLLAFKTASLAELPAVCVSGSAFLTTSLDVIFSPLKLFQQ